MTQPTSKCHLPRHTDGQQQSYRALDEAFLQFADRECPVAATEIVLGRPRDLSSLLSVAELWPPSKGMNYVPNALHDRATRRVTRALTAMGCPLQVRVLEIGCGRAENGLVLASLGHSYTGLDMDDRLFPQAAADTVCHGLTLVKHMAERLPFDDNSFDGIVSFNTCEHIKDLRSVILEVQRVLRPGGVFYTEFGPPWNYAFGPHLVRSISLPHLQHIFPEDVVATFVQRSDAYSTVNRQPLSSYRGLFRDSSILKCTHYREYINAENLWARRYFLPSYLGLGYDELCVARIDVALTKSSA